MRRQSTKAGMKPPAPRPPARGVFSALGAIGAAGLVWLGIREFPAIRREIKMWMM
jgi:hypothetical protein